MIYPFDEPNNDDIRKRNFPLTKATMTTNALDYKGVLKKTPSVSRGGLRTLKSLSDTISIQKKTPTGTDRLKRLDSTTSLFQRQTSFITRKVSTLATKLVHPFANLKRKDESTSQRQCFLVEKVEEESNGRRVMLNTTKRQVQVLSVNNEIRREPSLIQFPLDDEPKRNGS